MDPDLGDLLVDYPLASLSIHLGTTLPAGTPSLASLVDATWPGYSPSGVMNGLPSDQGTGFSFLSCQAQFRCLDPSGATAVCLWVTSVLSGNTILVAYQTLDPGELVFAGAEVLTIDLTITIFQAPSGFY